MKILQTCLWVAITTAISMPAAMVSASGLGKFVQVGELKKKACRSKALAPSEDIYKIRGSAMLGTSVFPDEGSKGNDYLSLYLDGGYRVLSDTTGCKHSRGVLSSSNWWWYSLSIGVDAELIFDDMSESPVGPMVAWDMRAQSKGFLAALFNPIPLGFGATAGPYIRGDQIGIGGSLILSAIANFRFGLRYDLDDSLSWSAHIGFVDPHLIIYRLLNID